MPPPPIRHTANFWALPTHPHREYFLCGVFNQKYSQSRSGGVPLFCCQLNVTDSASYPDLEYGFDTVLSDSNNSGLFTEHNVSVWFFTATNQGASSYMIWIRRNTRRHFSNMVSNVIIPSTPASTKGRFPPKFFRPKYLPCQTNSAARWTVSP